MPLMWVDTENLNAELFGGLLRGGFKQPFPIKSGISIFASP